MVKLVKSVSAKQCINNPRGVLMLRMFLLTLSLNTKHIKFKNTFVISKLKHVRIMNFKMQQQLEDVW